MSILGIIATVILVALGLELLVILGTFILVHVFLRQAVKKFDEIDHE